VVCDHLGTPLTLHDAQGETTWELQLDSYGNVRRGRGRTQDCPFRYQGQYEDAETGLYYNRFHYFDPETGNYISHDPIRLEWGIDLYGYVANPNFWGDPFGLAKTSTSTLRKIWTKYSGTTSSGQVHHGLPEQLAGDFKNLGNLNVNNGKYFLT
jgi:RHS repeat-associated protein